MTRELAKNIPSTPREVRRWLAYLIRAAVWRMSAETLGEHRYGRLGTELPAAMRAESRIAHTPLAWFGAMCSRFGVAPAQADERGYQLGAFLPDAWAPWTTVVSAWGIGTLRDVINDSADLIAAFALARRSESDEDIAAEHAMFDSLPDPPKRTGVLPKLPTELIPPRSYVTVWTQADHLHHGADEKTGNVSGFRRFQLWDHLENEAVEVPGISGNSWRGVCRDMVFSDLLTRLCLRATDVMPARAHALLAGGNIEKGADTAKVALDVRRSIRAMLPMFDLLGGCVEQQIMAGCLKVADAVLVCRENAWRVHPVIANEGESVRDLTERLPSYQSVLEVRQLTRQSHKELEGGDGVQMIARSECTVPGTQWVHRVHCEAIGSVPELTRSALAHMLDIFKRCSMGGGSARMGGKIMCEAYAPAAGADVLPDPGIYLDDIEARRDELIAWLTATPATRVATKPAARAKGGRKDREAPADEDIGL